MTTNIWNIDTSHSSIAFSIRHMVFAKVRGQFTSWQGTVEMDPADMASARIDVTIAAQSIDTSTEQRDEHLRSADFLDVEAHPEITFRSTRIIPQGEEQYRLQGDLTIRGITRSVELDVSVGGFGQDPWGNQRVGFSATASILRSDFGLTWNQALEAGGVLVGDKLELTFDVQAMRALAQAA